MIVGQKRELYKNFEQEEYMKIWFGLVEKMNQEGFIWSSLLENEEWNQYMSPSLYVMSEPIWNDIHIATLRITHLLQKTYEIIKQNRELLFKLKIPYPLMDAVFAEQGNSLFSYFIRYDLIVHNNQIKLIEANVDTPTGLMEPSVANRIICEEYGVLHPNTIEKQIEHAWERIISDYDIQETDKIFFTSFGWHEEDSQTTLFIKQHCNHPLTEYVDIADIIVSEDGLYHPSGEQIRFLYRLYPLEFLLKDVDDEGNRIGETFLELIAENKVKLINPPSAFLIQTKTILAFIWELFEQDSPLYTKEEKEVIQQYFLPTYFSPEPFISSQTAYVAKPIWGREGGGVSIIENEEIIVEDQTEYYYQQDKIYQQYIEMPDQAIGTWDGDYHGKLLIGSHAIGGTPAGIFLRVGEKITGNLSMFMGLTVENQ